jgi:hypothetical protein
MKEGELSTTLLTIPEEPLCTDDLVCALQVVVVLLEYAINEREARRLPGKLPTKLN